MIIATETHGAYRVDENRATKIIFDETNNEYIELETYDVVTPEVHEISVGSEVVLEGENDLGFHQTAIVTVVAINK